MILLKKKYEFDSRTCLFGRHINPLQKRKNAYHTVDVRISLITNSKDLNREDTLGHIMGSKSLNYNGLEGEKSKCLFPNIQIIELFF